MGSGYAKKKKEAKMLQQKFQEMQEKMKHETATGVSGNGLVSITLNGEHEMTSIKIKPDCVDLEDIEGLQDLIQAAYQDALKKLEANSSPIPGMPSFPSF
jgi:nucleoid-associated protein EbfC